jgi:hypothetical protein
MLSLKSIKRKYKIQLALIGISILASVAIASLNVLPKYLFDYRLPTIVVLIILLLVYSYILLLKNHIEDQDSEIESLNKKSSVDNSIEKKTLISSGKFQFDSKFGFYKNLETGELFCSPCLLADIPAQLKEYDDYWRCTNCGYWYYKEHYKPHKPQRRGNNPITNF